MAESPIDRRLAVVALAAMLAMSGVVAVTILSIGPTARAPRPPPVPIPAVVTAPPAPSPGRRDRRPEPIEIEEPEPGPPPAPGPLPAETAHLYGRIDGGGDVRIRACGVLTRAAPDGAWSAEVEAGRCEVVAIRQDGKFPSLSEPVDLELRPGDDRAVALRLPRHKAAGLGIAIRPSDEGFRVDEAIEGGAALDAGIGRGDLILEIDGEPTPGMALEEFQRWGIGKAGTTVPLVIRHRDGTHETVQLDRRSLD